MTNAEFPGPTPQLTVADLGLADPSPADLGGSPVMLHLYVPDVDALYAIAIAAGARELMPPNDAFWGDRYAQIVDPFGHRWSLGTQRDDPSADDLRERAAEWNAGQS